MQVTKRFFTPDLDTKALEESGLKGEGVRRPDVGDKYRIFVQSQGSGARHLAADTYLLYDDEKQVMVLYAPSHEELREICSY